MRERVWEIIIQACDELDVHIFKGVLERDHVHMFLLTSPAIAMQRIKGRSSRRTQTDFP